MANKEKQEYDYEGDMAMSQLKSIIANAQRMHDMLKVDTNLPEWVQSKITLAEDYISTASNYMQGEMSEEVNIDKYADSLIKRDKQNLSKSHVVHAARVAGVDHKKLMAAVNQKVGRIKEETLDELSSKTLFSYGKKARKEAEKRNEPMHRYSGRLMASKKTNPARGGYKLTKVAATFGEEVTHSVHVKTYDSHGEKQMNSPEFKKHVTAHGGELDYASDKGAAFKFNSASHAAAFHRGVQSKFKELDSEHDMHEEVAVNSVGSGQVAGLQGEPPVRKKKKNVMSFNRFMKK
jgi:hypothetical protein